MRGADARAWLGDLVTARIEDLRPGRARRSLLLTPTGRIRADFTVACVEGAFLLIQDPRQPEPVETILTPYVLSSEVELEDRTEQLGLLAFPNSGPRDEGSAQIYAPSCLGPGFDLLLPHEAERDADRAVEGLLRADEAALEAWRIERGVARFPADLGPGSLPHEAGLEHVIEYEKGCFLGQEAAARIRNLGHPPHVVLAGRAEGAARRGDGVVAAGRDAGRITSAAASDGGTAVILRVDWKARGADLSTASGVRVKVRGLASGAA